MGRGPAIRRAILYISVYRYIIPYMQKGTTLKDIARIAGVSIRTVSLAVSGEGRMTDETRSRILGIARELNYHPNLGAKGLRMSRSFLIAAVFPYLNISFFNRIIGGIEQRCYEDGFDILIASPPPTEGRDVSGAEAPPSRSLNRLIARKVDGIVASPTPDSFVAYQAILDAGIPLLQVMTRIPGLPSPFLGVDNELGGRIATRHLIELGHRVIGFLDSSFENYVEIAQRYQGYLKAFVENGIRIDPESVCVKAGTLLDIQTACSATRTLLARSPSMTAIFAPTDYAALGAIRACREAGKRVPQDVSVLGFDDIEIASNQIDLPLTTIAQPKEELGRMAFDVLRELMTEGRAADRVLAPVLVERSTTAKASGS
jgi:LacI family transcriptional regulator